MLIRVSKRGTFSLLEHKQQIELLTDNPHDPSNIVDYDRVVYKENVTPSLTYWCCFHQSEMF